MIEQYKPEIEKYGEKGKVVEAIETIIKMCKARQNYICIGMTKNLEKELRKKGMLK